LLVSVVPYPREATASTIEFLRPIPSVALIPLAVLLYGTELRSVLLLVVYASFWQWRSCSRSTDAVCSPGCACGRTSDCL
jgi:ABC-type nitrate/sulfonate/bicarbonate transport system permease component